MAEEAKDATAVVVARAPPGDPKIASVGLRRSNRDDDSPFAAVASALEFQDRSMCCVRRARPSDALRRRCADFVAHFPDHFREEVLGQAPQAYAAWLAEGYEVERVVSSRVDQTGTSMEFLVRWKGYGEEHDEWIAAGRVSRVEPVGGTRIQVNDDVRVVVSLGAKPRPLPSLQGLSLVAAESRLAAPGFRTVVVEGLPEGLAEGEVADRTLLVVVSQTPLAGRREMPATTVTLVVRPA